MRYLRLVWVALMMVCLFFSCSSNPSDSGDDGDKFGSVSSLTKQKVVTSNNTFGLELFRNIVNDQQDTNVFLSPLSVSLALSMALNGAANETETAMRTTLGFEDLTLEEVNIVQSELMELLVSTDPDVLFEIANSIWYREGYPVLDSFKTVNQTYYNAEIREQDFSLAEAVSLINGWISDATHGKIEEVLDRIDPDVVMYLINALYFKGIWQVEFDAEKTFDGTFYPVNEAALTTPMMVRQDTMSYYEDDKMQVVDLPYGDGKFSMMVLLPKEEETASGLAATLTTESYEAICDGLSEQAGSLYLPKFKIEYDMLLNDMLKAMGMGVAFSGGADFSNINGYGGLFISRVIHKTFVEVNEQGTEAAAVTVVEVKELCAPYPSTEFVMRVNRPFLFMIRDNTTRAIVFAGHVASPDNG